MLPYNWIEATTDPSIPEEMRRWTERSLTRMSRREAYTLAPWLKGKQLRDQFGVLLEPNFFRCAHFDRETKRCTDYHHRPDMCSGYPWYDNEPRPDAALPPGCSFRDDLIQIGAKP